jgi:hypothetical protein
MHTSILKLVYVHWLTFYLFWPIKWPSLYFTSLKIAKWLIKTCKRSLYIWTSFNILVYICWYYHYIYFLHLLIKNDQIFFMVQIPWEKLKYNVTAHQLLYNHQENYISTRAGVFYIHYRIFIMALYTFEIYH